MTSLWSKAEKRSIGIPRGLGFGVFLLIFGLTSCAVGTTSTQDSTEPEILVAAASDLRFAFADIGKQFEQSTGVKTTFTFGSSGQLKEQVNNGAPFDVFASANEQFVLDLVGNDRAWPETAQPYALGRIVMKTRTGIDAPTTVVDLVRDEFARIAIANPAHAPYGMAARESLITAGIFDQLESRLIFAENVSDTLRLVETGNVDVAIVALSLVILGDEPYVIVPNNLHKPLKQSIVVTKTGGNEKGARDFVGFLFSDKGRAVMESYGFVLPAGEQ